MARGGMRTPPEAVVTPLDVSLTAGNGFLVIELTGELDLATVGPLQDRFDAIADSIPDVLIIDLAGVSFLDSTALGLFTAMNTTVTNRGGVFVLVNVDRRVGRPLSVTGLDRVIRVHWADGVVQPWVGEVPPPAKSPDDDRVLRT